MNTVDKNKINKLIKEGIKVFPFTSEDDETLYLREPTRTEYGRFIQKIESDRVQAVNFLVTQCYVAGDKKLLEDNGFFNGMQESIGQIIPYKKVSLGKPMTTLK